MRVICTTHDMTRPKTAIGFVRLNLSLSPQVRERLYRLRKTTQAGSAADVVAKALAMYDYFVEAKGNGGKMFVKRIDGSVVEVEVL